jgi:tetratricopeptide repeat protein
VIPLLLAAALGVADPFTPPAELPQRENAEGFKLYRNREYAAAMPHFQKALAAAPDYDAARWNLATTYAALRQWEASLRELDPLLFHNFARYSRQVMSDPDWAPIRVTGKEFGQLKSRIEKARAAYTAGLERAVLVIGRTRPLVDSPVGDQVRTFRHAEIYAWDGRWRQLSETAGRVLTFVRSADGRRIAYVTQEKSLNVGGVFGRVMQDAQVFDMELRTLEPGKEQTLSTDAVAISLTYTQGELRVAVATREKSDEALVVASAGELVLAHAGDVTYYPPHGPPLQAKVGVPVDLVSLAWSPLRKQVLFRRHVPACSLGRRRGELYLYDVGKKQLTRIMSASALFDAVWVGWKAGKVTTLRFPHGGGLRSVPELPACGA